MEVHGARCRLLAGNPGAAAATIPSCPAIRATDAAGNISIAFDAKTNRFAGVTLAVATDAERAVANAVIEAANEALARSDARWTHAVREVPGGAEVLASGGS